MRAVPMMAPVPPQGDLQGQIDWCVRMIQQLSGATQDDPATIADSYKVTNLVAPSREMDASAATTDEVRAVLGTFLSDWRARGVNRGTG